MKPAGMKPAAQLFVCVNGADQPGAMGCGKDGPEVYQSLKDGVARRGWFTDVWVTRTQCLGHCPRRGTSVVVHPTGDQFVEVVATDASDLLDAFGAAGSRSE